MKYGFRTTETGKLVAVDDETGTAKMREAVDNGELVMAVSEMPDHSIVVAAFVPPEKLLALLEPMVHGLKLRLGITSDVPAPRDWPGTRKDFN